MSDNDPSDRVLLERHRNGDPDAFGEIVRRHRDRMWAVALRTLGDRVEELDARAVVAALSSAPIDLAAPTDGSGRAQLWPHRHGTDAMSISLLRRR